MRKLEAHGIGGKVLEWIKNWLSDRQQRVVLNGHASCWAPVTSGVPQGSVLGPTCFIIFINDLDEMLQLVDGFVYKFADDTKYGRVIRSEADRASMQRDIDNLMEWAERWQMDFNATKCKIMHIGSANPGFHYTMGGFAPAGTILSEATEEKDIGVIVHNSLKPSVQCAKAAKKANQVLGQMARSFHYRDRITWIHLYKLYVRPHLEISGQAWCPWKKTDIEILERVQERAVNMVVGLRSRTYTDRLAEVNLLSLEDRRKRGDAIQVWKYLHGINPGSMLKLASNQHNRLTRHTAKPMNIATTKGRLEVRRNYFTCRCAGPWNLLPSDVQCAKDLDMFKKGYDRFIQ